MKTGVLGCLFLLVLVIASGAQVAPDKLANAQFESLCLSFRTKLQQSLALTKIPGASAAFVTQDGRVCSAAAGMTRKSQGRNITSEDPILAASIGKTFVSALAMQLVEEGRLSLDAKIEHWLGEKTWFEHLPNGRDITVRQLMNHTSGIPDHVEEKGFLATAEKTPEKNVSFDYLLSFISDKKPLFPAGKGYHYADTNYILLAMIEEKILGSTMYDEVTRRFLAPLKLDHTSPSNRNVDPAVYGYYRNKPVVKNGRLIINPQWEWAGGGFWSTSTDLARWAKALYGGDVLKKTSLDEMIASTSTEDGKYYGLGVELGDTKWGRSYGHGGEWPGYLSIMRYYSKFNVSVAIQYNAGGAPEVVAWGESTLGDLASLFIENLSGYSLSSAEKSEYEKQVLDWLYLVHKGKLLESWDDISPALKTKYPRAAWPTALKPLLGKTGEFKSRKLKSVVRTDADTVALEFTSSFSKLPTATETVILKLGDDAKWQVSSYSIN